MTNSMFNLRSALSELSRIGEKPIYIDDVLDPKYEIAQHYFKNYATSPANGRSGDEPVVMYTRPRGSKIPVLMGLFGSRGRNEFMLGCSEGASAKFLSQKVNDRTPAVLIFNASSQSVIWSKKLHSLPVLTTTKNDAGPYITSGLVMAFDQQSNAHNLSIHRMKVVDSDRLTIWILPGRDLDKLHQKALQAGDFLPISINIGASPIVYMSSSISSPFLADGESELEYAGAIQNRAIEIAKCETKGAWCLAESEIVIEGMITDEVLDEYSNDKTCDGMPEFLGYMGKGKPRLPVVRVTRVTSKINPIYQTFLGPGKEQSELLALPTEAGILARLKAIFNHDVRIFDAHYLASSGGQLILVLQLDKKLDQEGLARRILQEAVVCHKLLKAVFLVDLDVNIRSESDIIWAISTRFQPSRDMIIMEGQQGFPLDPSQAVGYIKGTTTPTTDKYIMDLTVPVDRRKSFERMGMLQLP